jgi:uncharacterized DUF497 family protein
MKIEFDPAKDEANRIKHGVSLAAAAEIDLEQARIVEDRRFDYGETRFTAYAPLNGRLHALCFTWRGEVLRAIGLRKARRDERRRYDESR